MVKDNDTVIEYCYESINSLHVSDHPSQRIQ